MTDLDGNEAGEIEFEGNASVLRSRRGGAYALDTSIEAEWIVLSRLGVRLEPTFAVGREANARITGTDFGISGGVALKVLQDFQHELFVHAEIIARLPWDESAIAQPGDPALPLALDLRAGIRRAPLTLRWGIGVGAFGDAAHAPVRTSLAALTPFESSGRLGFLGVELDVDGARTSPAVAALNLEPNLVPIGIPFRVGFAVPWTIGERDDRPSLGFFVRIFYESAREIEFGQRKP